MSRPAHSAGREGAGRGVAVIPVLPRGVRLHWDVVRSALVLLAPERALMLDAVGHAILSRTKGA